MLSICTRRQSSPARPAAASEPVAARAVGWWRGVRSSLVITASLLTAAMPGLLAAQVSPAGSQVSGSRVHGRVLDHETGSPVISATVTLAAGPRGTPGTGTRVTDASGQFVFADAPAGTYTLTATSLGYRVLQDTLLVEAESDVEVTLELSATPIVLAPMVVTTRRRPWFMDGFQERRSRERTHSAFFTRDDIESRNIRSITGIADRTPGAVVIRGALDNQLTVDGGCRPAVWIDGYRYPDLERPGSFSLDATIPPDQVEAVELYTMRHEVPQRFGPACGAMVIWTRRPDADEKGAPAWRRWLMALGAIGAAILIIR